MESNRPFDSYDTMGTNTAWKAIWLNLVLLLVAYRYAESTSTLSTNKRPVEAVELKLICTDSGQITNDVNFLKGGTLQGGCIPDCGSGIQGYVINQDKSGGVTNLTITSVDVTRDAGSWTCLQVGNAVSNTLEIQSKLPNDIPVSSIVLQPTVDTTLTSFDGVANITASMPCAKDTPDFRWSYKQDSRKTTVNGTDDSDQGSCPSGEKIYSSTLLPSTLQAAGVSGTFVLQLEVEYDSFDPPTYTAIFSSGNIRFGATTPPSTPEATTATPTSTATTSSTVITIPVCVDVTICIVVGCIGGVAVVTGIFICCCCCRCCLPSCFPSQCPCCCRRARKKKSVTNGQTRTTSAEGEEQVAIDDYPTSQKTKGDVLEKRNGSVDNEDISIKIPDGQSDGMRDDRALYPVRKNESGMHRL